MDVKDREKRLADAQSMLDRREIDVEDQLEKARSMLAPLQKLPTDS